MRSLDTSSEDLLRQSTISFPTAPVAPTTPTDIAFIEISDAFRLDMLRGEVIGLGVFLVFEMELVCFTKEVDDEGLNPKAVEAVETARRRAAEVLNLIWVLEKFHKD